VRGRRELREVMLNLVYAEREMKIEMVVEWG
jgi:hypothetical protein